MKRTIATLILGSGMLLNSAQTVAEDLYQWKEADGSLTFSPIPPAADSGISYKKIGAPGKHTKLLSSLDTDQAEISGSKNSITSTNNKPRTIASQAKPLTAAPRRLPVADISSSPPNGFSSQAQTMAQTMARTTLPEGISRENIAAGNNFVANPATRTVAGKTVTMASNKFQHCTGLKKRIVSLENIMTNSSDADTMDNAVLQIFQYQKSLNQHCNETRFR